MAQLLTIIEHEESDCITLSKGIFAVKRDYSDEHIAGFMHAADTWDLLIQNHLEFPEYFDGLFYIEALSSLSHIDSYVIENDELVGFYYDSCFFRIDDPETHHIFNYHPGLRVIGGYFGCIEYTIYERPEGKIVFNDDSTVLMSYPKHWEGPFHIPDGTVEIASCAFFNCSGLTELYIPSSVQKIHEKAIKHCPHLAKLFLFNGKATLCFQAIYECRNIQTIYMPANMGHNYMLPRPTVEYIVHEDHPDYCAIDGVLFNKDHTILIYYPDKRLQTEYIVPEGVVIIDANAFMYNKYLTHIILPDTVKSIGNCAFMYSKKLKSIRLPNNLLYIHDNAFAECNELTDITLPSHLKSINNSVFARCKELSHISIPEHRRDLKLPEWDDSTSENNDTAGEGSGNIKVTYYTCENTDE